MEEDKIPLVYEHWFLDDTVSDEELEEEAAIEDPPTSIPAYARAPEAFFIDDNGATVFQPKAPVPGIMYQEAGRTVVRRNCTIDAFFGLAIRGRNRKLLSKIRISEVQPEIRISSNGSIGIRISIKNIADVPGSLSITVTRTAPGMQNPDDRQYPANDLDNLDDQINDENEIPLPPPTGMHGRNKPVVVETITAIVTWTPTGKPPCSITEILIIRWEFNFPYARVRWLRPGSGATGSTRARVSHGSTIQPYRDPNGTTFYSIPIQTFFPIDDPVGCCETNTGYSIIQFVRHEWYVLETPVIKGGDTWSLDVLDSEVTRANADPAQTYDPTFTHNPRGTRPSAPDLVYPGPDPSGKQSINQYDRPGIDPRLYRRMMNARHGSEFIFHFLSFLVCARDPSESADFLANGVVEQVVEYKIRIRFRGNQKEAEVSLIPVDHTINTPCKALQAVINKYDSNRRRRRQQGSLQTGYTDPRDHQVGIPK